MFERLKGAGGLRLRVGLDLEDLVGEILVTLEGA